MICSLSIIPHFQFHSKLPLKPLDKKTKRIYNKYNSRTRRRAMQKVTFLLKNKRGHAAIGEIEQEVGQFYFITIVSVENAKDSKKIGTRIGVPKSQVNFI